MGASRSGELQVTRIVAFGPSLVDISAKLPDHDYIRCCGTLGLEIGGWCELEDFSIVRNLITMLTGSNVEEGVELLSVLGSGKTDLTAGSSTLGMLSAMPPAVRRRATYISTLGRLEGRPDAFSIFFKQAVLTTGIAHMSSIVDGYNPVGFVLSSLRDPERTLAMHRGVALRFKGCDLQSMDPSLIVLDAHELVAGELAEFLDDVVNSRRWRIGLSLGDQALLCGEVLGRIRSYLFAGKLWIISGNEDEYRALFPELQPELASPTGFMDHPIRHHAPYALITFAERGLAAHWRGSFCQVAGTMVDAEDIVNTSGAGDTAAGAVFSGALFGHPVSVVLHKADDLARRVLKVRSSRIIA